MQQLQDGTITSLTCTKAKDVATTHWRNHSATYIAKRDVQLPNTHPGTGHQVKRICMEEETQYQYRKWIHRVFFIITNHVQYKVITFVLFNFLPNQVEYVNGTAVYVIKELVLFQCPWLILYLVINMAYILLSYYFFFYYFRQRSYWYRHWHGYQRSNGEGRQGTRSEKNYEGHHETQQRRTSQGNIIKTRLHGGTARRTAKDHWKYAVVVIGSEVYERLWFVYWLYCVLYVWNVLCIVNCIMYCWLYCILCIVLCNKTCKYNVSSLQCRTIKLTYMFWQGSQSDIQNV